MAAQIPNLFAFPGHASWAARSVPIGAGMPDLVIAAYHPEVAVLANAEMTDANIVAYLRAVRRARLRTIAERMRLALRPIERRLYRLVESDALTVAGDTFALNSHCRDVLPEIVTVEVKVGHWRRAIEQADRNAIFAHRSFVALPSSVAERVHHEPAFTSGRLGLLSVADSGEVTMLRNARRRRPRVWSYYYRVAALVGAASISSSDAFYRSSR